MTLTARHYENAFESFLINSELPFIPLSQTKKAIIHGNQLKSFDFIIHLPAGEALMVDIKGRKLNQKRFLNGLPGQNWVTRDDVNSMERWQNIFGSGHIPLFIFSYWIFDLDTSYQPNSDLYCCDNRYYWFVAIYVSEYKAFMKNRSPQWNTVDLPAKKFRLLAKPLNKLLLEHKYI